MSQRLQELGVDVTDRFWPANHSTELPHEYPFKLDYPEAQRTLQDTLQFLRSVT